ncbi:MAG: hypothetical protein HOB29_04310 [Planctomycetaceae bacterium]|nr:hypothetical protein [Planctomycetaceae bacterium]MBT5125291.1 hypothetical protein [Planctomycetaceae bacterium]MBT5884531.1 hypothetical protein [Planctomycetaceae bacterium]MBT7256192.1 hypothetical protein [Planctomycetaceae bacterium]
MSFKSTITSAVLATFFCVAMAATTVSAQDELEKRASWSFPDQLTVKANLDKYLSDSEVSEAILQQITVLWEIPIESSDRSLLLDQLINSFALANKEVRELTTRLETTPATAANIIPAMLTDESQNDFLRNNLRLFYARWLAHSDLQDECLQVLEGITPNQVVDPATLLFYQATGYHRLLAKDVCLQKINLLLENEEQLPRRYSTIANLMKADVGPLKPDSLDEVARLMADIRRRLKLGRAGTRVRQEEEDVIAKLDKMIEELEQQQQQQQSGSGGGSSSSSSPAQDSSNLGGSGPGNVDKKSVKEGDDWGALPPRERQKALQQISKELPAHYREVIEEYFRKLARDEG